MPEEDEKMKTSDHLQTVLEEMKHIDHFLHAGGGAGDGTGIGSGAGVGGTKYYAACDTGAHPSWLGPNRDTRDLAQGDADSHNSGCDARGAQVIG